MVQEGLFFLNYYGPLALNKEQKLSKKYMYLNLILTPSFNESTLYIYFYDLLYNKW